MSTIARRLFFRGLESLRHGSLRVVEGGGVTEFGISNGGFHAEIAVHDPRFYHRAVFGGDIGIGESFMDGEWSSPDLVSLIRVAIRNLDAIESNGWLLSLVSRGVDRIRHLIRANTIDGSRRNIQEHYDLSNELFELFLDEKMVYSCAWFENSDDSLEVAQVEKLDRICRKLDIGPNDRVLEIGTGWGAFAVHAAKQYGCRVTTTTISREQYDHANRLFDREGVSDRVTLLLEDYRRLEGRFDKIVSIEMFEAVGFEYYDEFFGTCDRLLSDNGTLLLQTITILDQQFDGYRRRADWIQKHIFPGAELASVGGVINSLGRSTNMALHHAEDMGIHYALTLREWSRRFESRLDEVRHLGFDDRFIRMWRYYLAYCEAGFLERHISDTQLLLSKNHNRSSLFGDPNQHQERTSERVA